MHRRRCVGACRRTHMRHHWPRRPPPAPIHDGCGAPRAPRSGRSPSLPMCCAMADRRAPALLRYCRPQRSDHVAGRLRHLSCLTVAVTLPVRRPSRPRIFLTRRAGCPRPPAPPRHWPAARITRVLLWPAANLAHALRWPAAELPTHHALAGHRARHCATS
jgi:hypothetical protein